MLLTAEEIRKLIGEGNLVQNMVDPEIQVQQSGVDLTVANVFTLEGEGILDFTNEKRKLPEYREVPKKEDYWSLEPGVYHIAFNEKIILPRDVAAILMPRSSALVCGAVQHSALWDPGYEGRSFFHIEISRPVKIYKNARMGQMIFLQLHKETEAYTGMFKGEDILEKKKRGT